MSKDLKFNSPLSQFDLEKLKLLFFNNMQSNSTNGDKTININYCPSCKNKLKNLKIDLKENEIICYHCNNMNICKLYDEISLVKELVINLDFICPNFVPNFNYLK